MAAFRPFGFLPTLFEKGLYHQVEFHILLFLVYAVGTFRLRERFPALFWYCVFQLALLVFVSTEDWSRYFLVMAPFALIVGYRDLIDTRAFRWMFPVFAALSVYYAWGVIPLNGCRPDIYLALLSHLGLLPEGAAWPRNAGLLYPSEAGCGSITTSGSLVAHAPRDDGGGNAFQERRACWHARGVCPRPRRGGDAEGDEERRRLECDAEAEGRAVVFDLDAVPAGGNRDRQITGVGDADRHVFAVEASLPDGEIRPGKDQVPRSGGLDGEGGAIGHGALNGRRATACRS